MMRLFRSQASEHDRQVDNEDDCIIEQIDAVRKRKGRWEYRVIWKGYPDPTWETAKTLAEDAQAMMPEAK
eukprot:6184953-Pleurochrysis_carterae.AAC.2